MLVLSTHKPKCINETDAAVHAASLPSRSVRSISLTLPRWQRKDAKRCPYTTGREYAFLQQTLKRQCTSQRCVTASSDKHVGYSFTKMPKAKQIRSAGLLWLHTRYTSPRESPVQYQSSASGQQMRVARVMWTRLIMRRVCVSDLHPHIGD